MNLRSPPRNPLLPIPFLQLRTEEYTNADMKILQFIYLHIKNSKIL